MRRSRTKPLATVALLLSMLLAVAPSVCAQSTTPSAPSVQEFTFGTFMFMTSDRTYHSSDGRLSVRVERAMETHGPSHGWVVSMRLHLEEAGVSSDLDFYIAGPRSLRTATWRGYVITVRNILFTVPSGATLRIEPLPRQPAAHTHVIAPTAD